MTTLGPDFIALQVHDVAAAARFFEDNLGLPRAQFSPPGAVVFDTQPISFAVRSPLPGIDPAAASPGPGHGVALWMAVEDADALHERLVAAGVRIVQPPSDSPFGRMIAFIGPEGYVLTAHGSAAAGPDGA